MRAYVAAAGDGAGSIRFMMLLRLSRMPRRGVRRSSRAATCAPRRTQACGAQRGRMPPSFEPTRCDFQLARDELLNRSLSLGLVSVVEQEQQAYFTEK